MSYTCLVMEALMSHDLARRLLVNLGKTGKTENTVKSEKSVIQVEVGEV